MESKLEDHVVRAREVLESGEALRAFAEPLPALASG